VDIGLCHKDVVLEVGGVCVSCWRSMCEEYRGVQCGALLLPANQTPVRIPTDVVLAVVAVETAERSLFALEIGGSH